MIRIFLLTKFFFVVTRGTFLTAKVKPNRPLVNWLMIKRIMALVPWFRLKMELQHLWKPTRQCAIMLSLTS